MKNQYNIYDFKLIGLFENYIIAVLYYYKKRSNGEAREEVRHRDFPL